MPGVQVTDLFTLKTISQPQSAGDHTFFVQNEIDQAANGYTANIYSLDDNQQIRQWTNAGLNLQPTVAGNFLYYRSKDSDGQFQLMQMPIDGDVAKQLTTGDSIGQIMLSSNQAELFLKTVHTPTPDSNPFPTRHVTKVQNKADGQGWLPTDNTYTLDRFELTTGKQSTLWTSSHDFNLQDISPSSNQILYLAPTHSEWQNEFDTTQGVFLYDLELDKTELLTSIFATGVFSDAHFSADGQKVMLIGSDYSQYSATVNQLYLYDLKTKHFENITGDSDLDVGYDHGLAADMTQNASHVSGFWLANDQYLFHAYHHGHSQLYLWNGQTCTLLNDDHRDIVDFSVTNAGQIIMATSTPIKPSELKSLSLKTGNEVLLFNPNQNYEKDHTFAPVKSFYYPSTDQKVQLQGWLAEAQTAAAEAPLILYIHGGPHSAYGETFFHEFQALAAKGYHVVYFNPRGSTSYGQNFAADVMGRYGENDYADIMAGLDYTLAHFDGINKNKIFIAGGSYGGFLSSWTISHTDRFTAAIVQRPVTDWVNLYLTSDIGVRFVRAELGADLYQDTNAHQLYWEKSPMAYADKIKTPVRIQHGDLDCRCPVSQSESLFRVVKGTGTDCDYIRYPESYHGFSRNGIPSLRVQRFEDIVEWFNRYA